MNNEFKKLDKLLKLLYAPYANNKVPFYTLYKTKMDTVEESIETIILCNIITGLINE